MPTWSNQPPSTSDQPALPIRRAPANGQVIGIVTCDDLIGCDTHFYQGHTIPCERPDCEACRHAIPFRWHGYLSAIDQRTNMHFLFEFTAQASDSFIQYRDVHNGLKGCLFQAQRLHRRPNGRVVIQTKPAPIEKIRLPKPPDLLRCLATIWQIPFEQLSADRRLKAAPAVSVTPGLHDLDDYIRKQQALKNGQNRLAPIPDVRPEP